MLRHLPAIYLTYRGDDSQNTYKYCWGEDQRLLKGKSNDTENVLALLTSVDDCLGICK